MLSHKHLLLFKLSYAICKISGLSCPSQQGEHYFSTYVIYSNKQLYMYVLSDASDISTYVGGSEVVLCLTGEVNMFKRRTFENPDSVVVYRAHRSPHTPKDLAGERYYATIYLDTVKRDHSPAIGDREP